MTADGALVADSIAVSGMDDGDRTSFGRLGAAFVLAERHGTELAEILAQLILRACRRSARPAALLRRRLALRAEDRGVVHQLVWQAL